MYNANFPKSIPFGVSAVKHPALRNPGHNSQNRKEFNETRDFHHCLDPQPPTLHHLVSGAFATASLSYIWHPVVVMDDVISILSSPAATRDASPRIDLGVVEITDSEPEDLDNGNLFWTGLRRRNATSNPFLHRNKISVKEDTPMDVDVDVPTTVAGPSTAFPAPDPFPEVPAIHIQPMLDPQMTQEPDTDPYSEHLALVLEIIPDVAPTHAMELIERLYPTHKGRVAETVVQRLFDDPSYPKGEDGVVGKGKRKASELEDVPERPPSRVKIDFARVDRPKPAGRDYKTLALVSRPPISES